ncbi:MAG: glycosyl transferase group 1 [Acidimicrobiales bacterium]|nr:glycosyl transferase group 1 [Acidimicrobiales bacterium]
MAEGHRVLQVLGRSSGGIRRHVASLADGLEARGWSVEVAGPPGVMEGLRPLDHPLAVPRDQRALAALAQLTTLVRGADLVHAHGLTVGWLASLVPRRPPLVLTVHNLVLDEAEGRKAAVLRRLEGRLPARVDETIVISDEMARRFQGAPGADRVTVIPPAGPVPRPQRTPAAVRADLAVPDGVPLVVLVGRLHPQKDVGSLLEATRILRDRGVELRVAIVGEGPERDALVRRAADLGVDDVVTFTGRRDDAADHLAAADVVVMCSIWEGFGLVVPEALQLARPLVATAVGPVPRLVIDHRTGRLVPPSRPNRLADVVGELLADPQAARALGVAGREHVAATLGPDALIDRVVAVYDHLLEKR